MRRIFTRHVRESTRSLHTLCHTLISPTQSSLLTHLLSNPPPKNSTTLYLLSTSLPNLSNILSTLQTNLPNSIGSFSISPPNTPSSISLATFTPTSDERIWIFKSNISGRLPAEVGKWQRRPLSPEDLKGSIQGHIEMIKGQDGGGGGDGDGWANLWRSEAGLEMIGIPELEGVQASSFLLLTDSTPNPFLSTLNKLYPTASKLGLITAPTPFVTNRPHTLIRNREIYTTGSIGLAFTTSSSVTMEYGLKPLTTSTTIAAAQGNLLLKIDGVNSNPTQTLMSAIQKLSKTQTKDEEFYLALLDGDSISRVVKILSGDPSRGALSLDMEESLLTGQRIQFMHRPDALIPLSPKPNTIAFGVLPKTEDEGYDETLEPSEPRTMDGFLGLSEGGFVGSKGGCNVPGARGCMKF